MSERPRFPRQIPFIIGNEACERFSFYGMRNILTTFLAASFFAHLPSAAADAEAKDIFHIFVMGVYFFPLLGGFISDRILGKYKTIFALSLVYCAGHACLAIFEKNVQGFYTGLFLIAVGSGGIKPLVSSFVGDQFDKSNSSLARVVYDIFYWSINLGSLFASLIMPKLLKGSGATIAFAVPGVLMLLATIIFVMGRKKYVVTLPEAANPHSFSRVIWTALTAQPSNLPRAHLNDHTTPDLGNTKRLIGQVVAATGVVVGLACFALIPYVGDVASACLALVVILVGIGVGASLTLENARGHHPDEAIEGVRSVLRILVIFALVTPFWSLFDQKASTWVVQAKIMDKPSWFEPAMMQALNPALVMVIIPFNNVALYPFLRGLGIGLSPLRKMALGILFASFAWVAIGLIQVVMDNGAHLSILWQMLPYFLLTFGEVLVSATGLEFAYSQAPLAMKGVIMSFWSLAVTVGSLWVLMSDAAVKNETVTSHIASTGVSTVAFLMFFFAAFAALAAGAFSLYARRYRSVDNYRGAEQA
jgi:proton-dependent oligopeptide transporter, POT family